MLTRDERVVIGYLLDPANRATSAAAVRGIEPGYFLNSAHEHIYASARDNAQHGDARLRVLESLIGPNASRALNALECDLAVYLSNCVNEAEGVDEYRIGHYVGRVRDAYNKRASDATLTRFADAFDRNDTAAVAAAWADLGRFVDGDDAPQQDSPARSRIRRLTFRRSELSQIKPPTWLIDGVLNRASLAVLAGKFGTYKSFVSVALSASVATGKPFLGHATVETGPVIYIAAEGAAGIKSRFEAWEQAHNGGQPIDDDRLVVVSGPINLRDPEQVAELDELCGEVGPRLMVVDTMHRCAPGVEENSAKEMGEVIEVISGLRERHDCTILANHHTGHSGQRSRGSSSIEDDFDNAWVIKLAGDGEDRSPDIQRTMEHRKVKDGELSAKIPIGLVGALDSAYVDCVEVAPDGGEVKGWLAVKSYAQRLDVAGVPLDYGKDRVKAALVELGVASIGNTTAADIAKLRKAADYSPAKPSQALRDDPGA